VTIDATAALLERVFPAVPRISRPEYLHRLYEDSPMGPVVESNLDDEQGRGGHYALTPLELTSDGAPLVGALSLNTVVRESPLNLIYRDLRGSARPGPFARFELLDFDAC
jgi:hypothetical protein